MIAAACESGRCFLAVGDDITARAPLAGPLAGSCAERACHCATAILISKITSAKGIARGSYGMIIAQLEAREELDLRDEGPCGTPATAAATIRI